MGEFGCDPIYVHTYSTVIEYWFKLTEMDNDKLPKASYNMLFKLDVAGRSN